MLRRDTSRPRRRCSRLPRVAAGLALAVAVGAPHVAAAQVFGQELITGGGFDPGTTGQWQANAGANLACASLAGDPALCVFAYGQDVSVPPYEVISFIPAAPGAASQTFGTVPGGQYFLSFVVPDAGPEYFGESVFEVYWGTMLVSSTPIAGMLFDQSFQYWLTATAPFTTLRFQNRMLGTCNRNDCDNWGTRVTVDDVSVRQFGSDIVPTPEPATWTLAAGGLLLIGAVRQLRRARVPVG